MKILVSVDMEGVSGVVSRRETATGWPHAAPKGNDDERARQWMTEDANAAIRGALDGRGVLSHTFTGPVSLWDGRLNGEPASEARFNAPRGISGTCPRTDSPARYG